jgi:hypothetical protein
MSSGKLKEGNGTYAANRSGHLQNVIVHPFPLLKFNLIFNTLQTKGKPLAVSYGRQEYKLLL